MILAIQVKPTERDGKDRHTKPWELNNFFDKLLETLPKSSFPRRNEVSDGLG